MTLRLPIHFHRADVRPEAIPMLDEIAAISPPQEIPS